MRIKSHGREGDQTNQNNDDFFEDIIHMFEYGYISWNEYMDVCMYVQASELHMSLNMTCFACFQLFKASLHNHFHAFYLCTY